MLLWILKEKVMIKGIVFDLDHTLFDRYGTLRAVLPHMYKGMRHWIAEEISCEEFVEAVVEGDKQWIHVGWKPIIENLMLKGVFKPETEVKTVIRFLVDECWPIAAVEFPFAKPMLMQMREEGYKLGIITNGPHKNQDLKLDMLGLKPYVDEIVISGDLPAGKPERLPFDVMSERIGIPAGELLYVGDNPLNDVFASRNAGYIPVWVATTGTWIFGDLKRADYEIETIAEIPELVHKLNA